MDENEILTVSLSDGMRALYERKPRREADDGNRLLTSSLSELIAGTSSGVAP